MNPLWIDIERIALDGVSIDPSKGRRLAALTQAALERLLRNRGISADMTVASGDYSQTRDSKVEMKSPPAAGDEARWADELATALYRVIDRSI
jgi:hypothetical protein